MLFVLPFVTDAKGLEEHVKNQLATIFSLKNSRAAPRILRMDSLAQPPPLTLDLWLGCCAEPSWIGNVALKGVKIYHIVLLALNVNLLPFKQTAIFEGGKEKYQPPYAKALLGH